MIEDIATGRKDSPHPPINNYYYVINFIITILTNYTGLLPMVFAAFVFVVNFRIVTNSHRFSNRGVVDDG
jgi:hypothetical protein